MKPMSPPTYHHNTFLPTPALGHMMYGYTFLVGMNQRFLNKQSKERNIISHKSSTTHGALKAHRSKLSVIYSNHENNVPSRLSPQQLLGNSCTWAHDVRLHIAGTNEPKSVQQAKKRA